MIQLEMLVSTPSIRLGNDRPRVTLQSEADAVFQFEIHNDGDAALVVRDIKPSHPAVLKWAVSR
eukprot:SAG22_NODE_891_length_6647_cov_30.391723_7_plen_64_part_00